MYISGPITGTDDHEMRFAKAEAYLKKLGFSVINPEPLGAVMPEDAKHEEFMKICYPLLDLADFIYMLNDWDISTGAALEMQYAIQNKIGIIFEGGKV